MTTLAILDSTDGQFFHALLEACAEGLLDAQVAVLATEKKSPGVGIAEQAGIPIVFHPWGPYKVAGKLRATYDRDLALRVWLHGPGLVVATGWTRPLSAGFLERFPGSVLRLSFRPDDTGEHPHAAAHAYDAFQRGEITSSAAVVRLHGSEPEAATTLLAEIPFDLAREEPFPEFRTRLAAAGKQALIESVAEMLARQRT